MEARISKPVFRRGIFRTYEIRGPVDRQACNENARGHLLRRGGEVAVLSIASKHLSADLVLRPNRTGSGDTVRWPVERHGQTSGKQFPVGGLLKRVIDIVVGSLLILLLAPAMIGTAVLVRLFV